MTYGEPQSIDHSCKGGVDQPFTDTEGEITIYRELTSSIRATLFLIGIDANDERSHMKTRHRL